MLVKEDSDYEDLEQHVEAQAPIKNKKMSKNMKIFLTVVIILFLAGAAVGMYFFLKPLIHVYFNDDSGSQPLKNQSEPEGLKPDVKDPKNPSTIDDKNGKKDESTETIPNKNDGNKDDEKPTDDKKDKEDQGTQTPDEGTSTEGNTKQEEKPTTGDKPTTEDKPIDNKDDSKNPEKDNKDDGNNPFIDENDDDDDVDIDEKEKEDKNNNDNKQKENPEKDDDEDDEEEQDGSQKHQEKSFLQQFREFIKRIFGVWF